MKKLAKDEKAMIIFGIICLALAICFFIASCVSKASDSYIRDRVVQLKGAHAACTGIQVKAPSGNVYTMTAGHCKSMLAEDNSVQATDELGNTKTLYLIDVDEDKDLMLMTSMNYRSIEVAKKTTRHQHIHTLTHGDMHTTYRTDGELLELQDITILRSEDPAENMMCMLDIGMLQMTGKEIPEELKKQCFRVLHEQVTTAIVYPGSSGGPALNDKGELIGIVSISETGTIYSGVVPLPEIQSFLSAR